MPSSPPPFPRISVTQRQRWGIPPNPNSERANHYFVLSLGHAPNDIDAGLWTEPRKAEYAIGSGAQHIFFYIGPSVLIPGERGVQQGPPPWSTREQRQANRDRWAEQGLRVIPSVTPAAGSSPNFTIFAS